MAQIPKVVAETLRVAAPVLLAGISGPFAGIAASLATAALNAWLGPAKIDPTGHPSAPGVPQPASVGAATPAEIIHAVETNANDPKFLLDLRKAEIDLQKYEEEMDFKFEALALEDRKNARTSMTDLVSTGSLFGWVPGALSVFIVVGFFGILGILILRPTTVDQSQRELLAILLGALTAGFGDVRAFWLGSSASSRRQNDALVSQAQTAVTALGDAAKTSVAQPTALPAPASPPVIVMPPAVTPAPSQTDYPVEWFQGPFGGVRWRMDKDGYLLLEGDAKPARTVGEPITIRRIWRDWGGFIVSSCTKHAVPAEVVISLVAVESRGIATDTLVEPDKRTSSGLLQILTGTAADVVGRPVTVDELKDPAFNIETGVRLIKSKSKITAFDPILTASVHNAGGLYPPREQDDNPFKLRSTGTHLNRMRLYYNDTIFVSKTDGWFK